MSRRFAKLISTGFCLMMIIFASRHAEQETTVQSAQGRGPASVDSRNPAKDRILKATFDNGIIYTKKIQGPLKTQLEAVGNYAVAVGETFTLRGVISAEEKVSDVLVRWNIPQGLEVVSGSLQNTIDMVTPGEPVNIEVTLKKLTDANVQVAFVADAAKGTFKFGDGSQFNTVDQEIVREKIRKLSESNKRIIEEQRAESDNKELKIFH